MKNLGIVAIFALLGLTAASSLLTACKSLQAAPQTASDTGGNGGRGGATGGSGGQGGHGGGR